MGFIKQSGKLVIAIMVATLCAMPLAAAPAKARRSRALRTRWHHHYIRRRGVDPTLGDDAEYDDPLVRHAAVEAIGRYNGTIVAVDPNNGRILTVVKQKLAFSAGAFRCWTIMPTFAVAAVYENLITAITML